MRMLRMTTRRLMIGIAAAAVILGVVLSSRRRSTETNVAVLQKGHDHAVLQVTNHETVTAPIGYPLLVIATIGGILPVGVWRRRRSH